MDNQVSPPRQTVLGNYVLNLFFMLPVLLDFSANQAQFLQLIHQFARMGPEARDFLIRMDACERLLNFFYILKTPYRNDFLNAPRLDYQMTDQPEMGLPTPEDPSAKKSTYAMAKEKARLSKLVSQKPQYMYLITTFSMLIRSMHLELPEGYALEPGVKATPFQLAMSSHQLSQRLMVLFQPDPQFIEMLFAAAHKARAAVALSQAYVHYAYFDAVKMNNLFTIVRTGLENQDSARIMPFLILLQHLIECAQNGNFIIKKDLPKKLEVLFKADLPKNQHFFQWMEVFTDWVIKVAFRVPLFREWLHQNVEISVAPLLNFFKLYQEPPQQYHQRLSLHKPKRVPQESMFRNYRRLNAAHAAYRKSSLTKIKMGDCPDLSGEVDIDYYHLDDYKLLREQQIMIRECPIMNVFTPAVVATDMDEFIFIKMLKEDGN